MPIRSKPALLCLIAAALWLPGTATAQSFGLGPRLSFVRGDLPTDTPSTELVGGTMRIRSSRVMVLELALDYRAEFSDDRTTRVRQTPFQASLLLVPVRAVFSPYLLGGMGIYTEMTDSLDASGAVIDTVAARTTGWHLGAGAELFLTPHAALFGDYRFRFVRLGAVESGSQPIDLPGLRGLGLSHRGSMWTGGLAVYF
jgi:hypothetical protein